jgi:hypothetical protein
MTSISGNKFPFGIEWLRRRLFGEISGIRPTWGSALLVGTRSRDIQRSLESADPTRMLASRAQVAEVWHRHRPLAARNNRVIAMPLKDFDPAIDVTQVAGRLEPFAGRHFDLACYDFSQRVAFVVLRCGFRVRPPAVLRPASRMRSESFPAPTARDSTIDPTMVAIAPVAIWRACPSGSPGSNSTRASIIFSSLEARACCSLGLDRATSTARVGSAQPCLGLSRCPGLR